MYNWFENAMNWLGGSVSLNTLLIITICVLALVVIYLALIRKSKLSRRWLFIVAWAYAVYALLVVTNGMTLGALTAADIMLPVIFLIIVFVLEAIFRLINKREKPVKEEKTVLPAVDEHDLEQQVRDDAPVKKTRAAKSNTKTPAADAQDRKNARIEALGAKIERQRKQAELKTDAMTAQLPQTPYSEKTRAALAGAKQIDSDMDDLQRRIDALRSTTVTAKQATTTTTNKITKSQRTAILSAKNITSTTEGN